MKCNFLVTNIHYINVRYLIRGVLKLKKIKQLEDYYENNKIDRSGPGWNPFKHGEKGSSGKL